MYHLICPGFKTPAQCNIHPTYWSFTYFHLLTVRLVPQWSDNMVQPGNRKNSKWSLDFPNWHLHRHHLFSRGIHLKNNTFIVPVVCSILPVTIPHPHPAPTNSQDNSSPSSPRVKNCLNGPYPRGRGWGKSQFARWLGTSRLHILKGKRRNFSESGWRGITYQNKLKSVFEGTF